MAMVCEFQKYDEFSAVPVSSPSNQAVNEVSRSDGRAGRAFVRTAPYILDFEIHYHEKTDHLAQLRLPLYFTLPWPETSSPFTFV